MYLIQQITDDQSQTQTIFLADGTSFIMSLQFAPMQYSWFLTGLTYQNFTVSGIRIVANPNILRQYKNLIPFGIGCFSSGNRDPQLQEDFNSGNCQLYVLTAQDVQTYEEILQGE